MFLLSLFAFLALAGTVVTVFLTDFAVWWYLLFFLGYFLAANILFLPVMVVVGLFLPRKTPPEKQGKFSLFIAKHGIRWLMVLGRIRVRVLGRELLPETPCVIVSNHVSAFDPMFYLAMREKRNVTFISKEANFHIPAAGPVIRNCGFIPIDRKNALRAMRTLRSSAELMAKWQADVVIYPEGTRSKTGELLEFKEGAFFLAKRAGVPIAMMTTKGTAGVKKNALFHRTNAELRIFEVIDTEKVQSMTLPQLAEYCRARIGEELKK